MFSRTAKIYKSKDEHGDFVFPEQVNGRVNKNKTALALSGGGSRAFVTAMATIKFLTHKNLIDEISYISTISGSNWFIAPYIYSDVDMGIYRKPKNITMHNLTNDNISFLSYFAGVSVNDLKIYDLIKRGKKEGIIREYLWNYVCGKNFLESYGLFDMPVVEDEERADFYRDNNFLECIYPREDRPFWLSNATIRANNGPVHLTSCCMYSGIQSRVKIGDTYIGGYLIECPCINSENPNIHLEDYEEEVDVRTTNIFTLNDIIGTSSAAFANYIDEEKEKLKKQFHTGLELFGSVNPTYKFWDIKSDKNLVTSAVDGYLVDNTGIIALLARGCEKIMCMSANQEINNEDYHNGNFLHLFGKWREYGGLSVDDGISDTSQVFRGEDLDPFLEQIRERKASGGPVYVRIVLEVLENKRLCIKGGFNVELLMFFIYPCSDYISQLIPEVRDQIVPNGELANFPNYKTILQNKGSIAKYTIPQINSLSYYIQWMLHKSKDEIIDFI